MSDTPISDSTAHNIPDLDMLCRRLERLAAVRLGYIKQLESQNNAANESFRKLNIHALNLIDHIKRLEDAGDYLCAAGAFMGWHEKIEDWNKAKEAKP